MTKFTSLESTKEKKKTVFTKCLILGSVYDLNSMTLEEDTSENNLPLNFDNVLHIGFDNHYGDMFKCWNGNGDGRGSFAIYFGEKGDEF